MADELYYDDGEEEMRGMFQDNDSYGDKHNSKSDTHQETVSLSENSCVNTVACSQSESKKKTHKKGGSGKQRSSSSAGKSADGSSRSSGSRKGRQSKTPSASRFGRESRGEMDCSSSPCKETLPTFTSDIHVADNSFKLSLLDEVLNEKKMALMKSPEVIQFLKEQQSQTLAYNKKKFDDNTS